MSATACQLCGKPLSRIRLLREGDFCCRDHREEYRLRRGLNRVLEASEVSQLERRKERPQLIMLERGAACEGPLERRICPSTPVLAPSECSFLLPELRLASALRPARAGAVRASGHRPAAPHSLGRREERIPARIRSSMALRKYKSLGHRSVRGISAPGDARFRSLLGRSSDEAPRVRRGFDEPLRTKAGAAKLRGAEFSLRDDGAFRLGAVCAALRMPDAGYRAASMACAREAGPIGFPSGSLERGVPIPAARRRTGGPVQVPTAPFSAARHVRAASMAAGPRAIPAQFGPTVVLSRGYGETERSIHISGFTHVGNPMWAADSLLAYDASTEKRCTGAIDFWSAIPEFFCLAFPPLTMVPDRRPRMSGPGEGLFPLFQTAGSGVKRRATVVPPVVHQACLPPYTGTLSRAVEWRPGHAPAISCWSQTGASGSFARARIWESANGVGGTGAAVAPPMLPPRTLPAIVRANVALAFSRPAGIPLATATAQFAHREALAPFPPQEPWLGNAELGILGLLGGVLDEDGGSATSIVEDNFGSGLGRWVGGAEDWRLDAAGVRPGSLALFSPSLGMRDYDIEFLAKIESRGIRWVFRAADLNNYQMVSISLAGDGRTHALELTRRAVIAGVAETPVTMVLPVAVRSKASFRVQTHVTGADFTVEVEGQTVEAWNDSRLQAGGIGFLAEQEDRARLYWVKLSPKGRIARVAAPVRVAPRQVQGPGIGVMRNE